MAAIYSRPPCPHMCSTTLSLLTAEFFCFFYFHPFSTAYPGSGHRGTSLSREAQTFTFSRFSEGTQSCSKANRDIISPVSPGFTPGPPPSKTCPKHLNCLLLMWSSSSSTSSPSWMTQLLTLYLPPPYKEELSHPSKEPVPQTQGQVSFVSSLAWRSYMDLSSYGLIPHRRDHRGSVRQRSWHYTLIFCLV